jgi:hypothetical protein
MPGVFECRVSIVPGIASAVTDARSAGKPLHPNALGSVYRFQSYNLCRGLYLPGMHYVARITT